MTRRLRNAWAALRGYAAAQDHWAYAWAPSGGSATAEVSLAAATVARRARDAVRNDPYASRIVDLWTGNAVGAGITTRWPDDAHGRAWQRWAESTGCDAEGRLDLYGLQALVMRAVVESGECFVRFLMTEPSPANPIGLRLQVLESDHLDTARNGMVAGAPTIQGIVLGEAGEPVGYWLHRVHPSAAGILPGATWQSSERIAGIDAAVEAARALLPPERITPIRAEAITQGWTGDQARRALFDALVAQGPRPSIPARPETGPGHDDPAQILDAMAEAIAARAMPGYQPQGSGRHAEFLGWRPSDMLRELLARRGDRNPPRNPTLLAERAFHTTSDFPALLSAAANKMLLAAYQPAQPTYRQVFLRRDFRDFKPHRHLRIGDFPTLLPLAENGEIQVGTMSESQEIVLLQTFARRLRVTRPMLVNDDLGAFTDFASMIGRRVAEFENATAYTLLNSANGDGPTLATGSAPVFATGAARANKAGTGTVLDTATIGAGRAAIMKQRSLDGLPISTGQTMRLLVGPNLELAARQATVPVAATQTSNANVFAGFVQPVVEPLIPGNRWYLFADPVAAPVYVYGYLNGAEGPQVTTGPVQGADGIEVSVIFDFGVGAIDWRGAWFNPGT